MKIIRSEERSTGMGAKHYEAILKDGQWVKVSDLPDANYEGREAGYECFEIMIAENVISAHFYRSNSGKETVTASNDMEWHSFDAAHRWAATQK